MLSLLFVIAFAAAANKVNLPRPYFTSNLISRAFDVHEDGVVTYNKGSNDKTVNVCVSELVAGDANQNTRMTCPVQVPYQEGYRSGDDLHHLTAHYVSGNPAKNFTLIKGAETNTKLHVIKTKATFLGFRWLNKDKLYGLFGTLLEAKIDETGKFVGIATPSTIHLRRINELLEGPPDALSRNPHSLGDELTRQPLSTLDEPLRTFSQVKWNAKLTFGVGLKKDGKLAVLQVDLTKPSLTEHALSSVGQYAIQGDTVILATTETGKTILHQWEVNHKKLEQIGEVHLIKQLIGTDSFGRIFYTRSVKQGKLGLFSYKITEKKEVQIGGEFVEGSVFKVSPGGQSLGILTPAVKVGEQPELNVYTITNL